MKKKAKQYYRCKQRHAKLYEQLKEVFDEFTTEERLLECLHWYDTQVNEGMNNAIAGKAPKHKTYGTTMSLHNRVSIAIGLQVWGETKFWGRVFETLGISTTSGTEKFWAKKDTARERRRKYAHLPKNKVKRKKNDYEKMKQECEKQKKDIEAGLAYGDDNKADLGGNMVSSCKCPGCPRTKNHKTAQSKNCLWHNKLIGVKNNDVPATLAHITSNYSPATVYDVAELLLRKLEERNGAAMSVAEAS
jgi:hypothetical protein